MENIKKNWYNKLPKWLQSLLLIISLVTFVYWVGFLFYKILDAIRKIGAFIFDNRNYWTFLTCILILVVGALLLGQFYFNLDPFGKMADGFNNMVYGFREYIANLILGN